MRNQLLDILQHTWYTSFFEFLNFYHIKDTVVEIIPDLYGKVTDVDPRTHQLVTDPSSDWLEVGLPLQFLTSPDGSTASLDNAELDTAKTYYVNTLWKGDHCIRFTVGEEPVSSSIVEIPFSHFAFNFRWNRSYLVLKDASFLDLDMRVIFENFPNINDIVKNTQFLNIDDKFYVDEIFPENRIRVKESQDAEDFVHFVNHWRGSFEIVQDNTFVEAVSMDNVVYFSGQTDEKIRAFNKSFGMDNLGKIWEQLQNIDEYSKGSNIKITNSNEDGEYVSSKITFTNDDETFTDTFPLVHKKDITPEIISMKDFSDSMWNITFKPTEVAIRRFDDMYITYDEFRQFDIYTKAIDAKNPAFPALQQYLLEIEQGEDHPKEGQMMFDATISGTYIPRIIYEFNTRAEPIAWYTGLITGIKPVWVVVYPYLEDPEKQRDEGDLATDNLLYTDDTSVFKVGMPVQFENPADSAEALLQAGIPRNEKFYICNIVNCNHFQVSTSPFGGEPIEITAADFEFWMEIQHNALEMTHPHDDPTRDDPNYHSRNIIDYIVPGMKIQFENTDDSALALEEATLDPAKEYYVKEVYVSDELEVYLDTEKPVLLNENTGEPIEDLLNPKARYPDKENRPIKPTETTFRTRFTISETLDGEAMDLPFCNFNFTVKHHVHQIFVDDTHWFSYRDKQPIKFVKYIDPEPETGPVIDIDYHNIVGLDPTQTYYVHSTVDKNYFYISDTPDGEWIELGHTTDRCEVHHNTGNGLIFTSNPRFTTELPYTRRNIHRVEINPIPKDGPYTFTFGGITVSLTHNGIYGPYYVKDTDYTIGRGLE